jgi:ATP-dependent Clp protease ATP-binding subunit ClpC
VFTGFNETACRIVSRAEREAVESHTSYVGAEHILLGLLTEQDTVAAQVLSDFGFSAGNVTNRLAQLAERDGHRLPPDTPARHGPFIRLGSPTVELRFAPRALLVLEMAVREALVLGSGAIGPEHLLLGLSRESDSIAMRVLYELDAELPHDEQPEGRRLDTELRNAVIRSLSQAQHAAL